MKRLIGGSGGANAAGGQAGNTQVQFNDNGAFGGDADFTYNKTTNQVTLGGDINLNDGGSFTTTLQVVTPTAARTISFPDATGTVGLVAGSSGQVVYNNAGRYAGISTLTFDGIDVIQSSGRYLLGVTSANANGGTLQLSGGITFPATQVAATDPNTLDDYEEGTFTPTIIGISTAGAGTYTTQTGRYTKVGSSVFYAITVTWTAHTGTGTMRIAGLPFTASSVSGVAPASAIYVSNMTLPASTTAQANVVTNTAQINIVSVPVGGGADASVTLDAAASISVSGYYII